jgi:hypothetical protein
MKLALLRGHRLQRYAPCFFAVVAAAAAPTGVVAHAATLEDCSTVNRGSLDVSVASAAETNLNVKLRKGDALIFAYRTGTGPTGFVTLSTGAGNGRVLLAGPDGTSAAYVAEKSGEVSLLFATQGGGIGAFSAKCVPAAEAGSAHAPRSRSAARFAPAMMDPDGLRDLPSGVPDTPIIDAEGTGDRPSEPGSSALGEKLAAERAREQAQLPPAWVQLEGSRPGAVEGPAGETTAGPANLGLKLKLQPAIMVGMSAQYSQADQADGGALAPRADQSWLVGPVTALQLGRGLSLDARAAWGASDTGSSASGEGADRRLVEARLANTQAFGAWRFSPSVMLNYQQETRHAAHALGPQTSGTGRVDVRPEVAYRIDVGDSLYVEPKAMIGPTWGLGDVMTTGAGAAAHPEMRLKAETGIIIGAGKGTKVQIGGSVEEGGPSAANVWSGRLQLNVPLK